jgi:hypothetical protein
MTVLDRATIVEVLTRLNSHLETRGERAELFLVGDAVMCLLHRARPSTKDVDAWFTSPQAVRAAAEAVATEMGLDKDWLDPSHGVQQAAATRTRRSRAGRACDEAMHHGRAHGGG